MKPFYFVLIVFTVAMTQCAEPVERESEQAVQEDTTLSKFQVADTVTATPDRPVPLNNENYVERLESFWEENEERTVKLVTDKGEIVIRLYEETPIHSSNFLMLTKRDYFDETLFTRVVPDFIIQGGSTDKEEIEIKRMLIGNHTPLPEFRKDLIHKRGAVSMARQYDNNPDKRSSTFNFFIVVGRTFNEPAILGIERDHNKSFSAEHREIYRTLGGAPHLDGEHTVFGEVITGMDVADAISEVETDIREWPKKDIAIIEAVAQP